MDNNQLKILVEKVKKGEATSEEKNLVYKELAASLNTLNGLLEDLLTVVREEKTQ
jgi:hypothetical protein